MSDAAYFFCLGITILCTIVAPACLFFGCVRHRQVGFCAFVGALSVVLGFMCSLPFGPTKEAPWLPWIAAVYFGTLALSALLYGAMAPGRRLREGTRTNQRIEAD